MQQISKGQIFLTVTSQLDNRSSQKQTPNTFTSFSCYRWKHASYNNVWKVLRTVVREAPMLHPGEQQWCLNTQPLCNFNGTVDRDKEYPIPKSTWAGEIEQLMNQCVSED